MISGFIPNSFETFLFLQKKKIESDKWFYGESIKSDPGDMFVIEWVDENAKNFRDSWNKSLCKSCIKCHICGINLKEKCENYGNN